ncbi:MAG: Metalloenzyme, LuxS/M16 peptidase-like protein [Benjaminiella poitrasii]|nr:MAG: Metalloenzyme, LuxS/M16 peptidase-like protein [Benjaminiella poitrasii]
MLAASRKAILNTVSKASYSTAAATANAIQFTSAANGVKVASSQEPGQAASLAIVINGGARAESHKNVGVAHYLKNYGFKNNTSRTAFRISREAELAGGVLSSNLSHETMVYSAEFLKDDVELFAEILGDVVSKQKYQEHEFIDVANQTLGESANAIADSEVNVIEAAHQTAFRTGLGHSIFAKPTAHVTNADVKAFAKELFTQGNIAVVGTGIDHEYLQTLAETYFNLPAGQLSLPATQYYGGESRVEAASKANHYVLAFEGAALNTPEFAALQVLRYALGGDMNVKNVDSSSLLSQTAKKFTEGTQIKAFNVAYSDAGLFGLQVSAASAADTGAAIAAATEQLKAAAKKLSGDDFSRALAQAKYAATSGFETRLDRLETLGTQALHAGKNVSAMDYVAAVEKVSTSDVAKVAEKLVKSKPTAVALGNLSNLPYADSFSL